MLKTILREVVTRYPILPRVVDLEVTKKCNLKCIGCPRQTEESIARIPGPPDLTPEALKAIQAKLPSLRIINLLGDGEPLMNPYLLDLIKLNTSKGISTMFTTNGMLITEDFARCLSKEKIRSVVVSLDSLSPDIFSSLRPGGDLGRVLLSLEYLRFYKVPTRINSLVVSTNVGEKETLTNLANNIKGVKGINFLHPIYAQGSDLEGLPYSRAPVTPTFRGCLYPFMWPYITLTGDIYACCFTVGSNRTEWLNGVPTYLPNDNYKMGNILPDYPNEDFKALWYGRKYRNLRNTLRATNTKIGKQVPTEELTQRSREANTLSGFNYCSVCLYRWGCSC